MPDCPDTESSIYSVYMSLSALPPKTQRLVLFAVALALLFAQGVRLCVHPHMSSVAGDATVASVPAVHLESLPNADDGAIDDNQHAPFAAALVKFAPDIPFVFLVTVLFLFGVGRRPTYLRQKLDIFPVARSSWSLRPPLRAPPL